jgi:glycosyltransferase involved in cell wall biosynthesis
MNSKLDVLWTLGIDPSGYSSCARSYIKALHKKSDVNISAYISNIAQNINNLGIDKDELLFFSSIASDFKNHELIVQHSVPDRFIIGESNNIGYTVVEMECPNRWVNICNKFDLIMTASNFCKEKMIECGIREHIIEVIPHCHDSEIWNPEVKGLNISNLKDYNFLFIGDYTPRKGGDLLIESFIKTFRGNKNVSLTIKGYFNSFSHEDQNKLIERIRNVIKKVDIPEREIPSVYFYGQPIPECLMPRFMASFDCLVFPHRGEGWGLACSQMQFLGKPVIATGYSGNLDFMNDKISHLIETDGFEYVCDEMIKINPNFANKEWIKIKEKSLCELMEHVYYNSQESRCFGKLAYDYMLKNFSYNVVSDKIIDLLRSGK